MKTKKVRLVAFMCCLFTLIGCSNFIDDKKDSIENIAPLEIDMEMDEDILDSSMPPERPEIKGPSTAPSIKGPSQSPN